MGIIAKKGTLFLGKRGSRLPKSARRARKPLSEDWITGKRPSSLKFANNKVKDRLKEKSNQRRLKKIEVI